MKVSKQDFKRFSKQIILKNIGIAGQKKIFNSKVLVVGAGGLGCPLILYLANSGVGTIGIIDDDKVDLSNLNRQILFSLQDIGKFKVYQAKKIIKKINKKIKVKIFKNKINKKNIKNIFKDFEIICDGSDNFETRYLINDHCLKYKKILISAAISKFDGQIFNFNFKKKIPCFRCFMPETPNLDNNCETDGIVSTLAGIAGTLQANEVIKTILNTKNDLIGKVLVFNSITSNFRKIKLTKNSDCIEECVKN
ncbi:MAG: molybdopterin biosynthesis protein [Candidatus Pelagibacter sp.]|nr:molybdopterin biosynthesis protein [Candidatus Pelagibacter sp.]RPG11698.1 MAG: HesA/MoeB/ThiF family protein [Pelagibacteraceae bacterium TMED170]|tara:strand:- start:4252 stop:5004 length:753 start_codon:yes stop_codon:yes gene_type:complete